MDQNSGKIRAPIEKSRSSFSCGDNDRAGTTVNMNTKADKKEDKALAIHPEQTLLVDIRTAAAILGLPLSSVRRLIAEDRIPAIKAGKGGKFVARNALVKFVERIK